MRCTTEETEEFFKDKIDWKLFNYLRDRLTYLEDSGTKCELDVSIPILLNNGVISKRASYPILTYNQEKTHYIGGVRNIYNDYEKVNFLMYQVYIYDDEKMEEYISIIKRND